MKTAILIICLFAAMTSTAQVVVAPHLDYSVKHHVPGGGFDAGYNIGNSYVGINTHVLFTNKRDVPVYVNLQYGYKHR